MLKALLPKEEVSRRRKKLTKDAVHEVQHIFAVMHIDADGLRLKICVLFQHGHGNASRVYSGNVADVEQFDRSPAKGMVLPRTQKAHKLSVLREHAPLIFLNDDLHMTPLTRNTAVLSKTPDGARRAYG